MHGVRGTSRGIPARGPGVFPRSQPPRAPLAPCFTTLRQHSAEVARPARAAAATAAAADEDGQGRARADRGPAAGPPAVMGARPQLGPRPLLCYATLLLIL